MSCPSAPGTGRGPSPSQERRAGYARAAVAQPRPAWPRPLRPTDTFPRRRRCRRYRGRESRRWPWPSASHPPGHTAGRARHCGAPRRPRHLRCPGEPRGAEPRYTGPSRGAGAGRAALPGRADRGAGAEPRSRSGQSRGARAEPRSRSGPSRASRAPHSPCSAPVPVPALVPAPLPPPPPARSTARPAPRRPSPSLTNPAPFEHINQSARIEAASAG